MRKEGLGIYTYLSGARYEGEWRDNQKDGRGVYFFPKVSGCAGHANGGDGTSCSIVPCSTQFHF